MTQEEKRHTPINPKDASVLVVEDNPANFALMARLLAFTGVGSSEWKTSGWGVVEFAENMGKVDLVLMDLRLPVEDGYDALKQVRASEKLKETLVVLVTAHGSYDEMERAKAAGFDGFIAKPLSVRDFPDQIRAILRGESVWVADSKA
ncbi:MAG: response regulator [Candidatus Promineifilaceae bacterium]